MQSTKIHRDTTIKEKAQPLDVPDNAGDIEDEAETVLEHSTNIEIDEDKLVGQRAGIGVPVGSEPDER